MVTFRSITRWFLDQPAPTASGDILACTRRLGLTLDPAQARLVTAAGRRVIVNCCRQWGKTTGHRHPRLLVRRQPPGHPHRHRGPQCRQSGEFVMKASVFLRRLGQRFQTDGLNRRSIRLANGSRIVGIPSREATIRGLSGVNFLVIDEASRTPDDIYLAVRPMLATTNGDLWLLSTPNGKRGFFYEVWKHGGPAWDRHSVPASECPRISPEFLDQERLSLPENHFLQEYCCEFVHGDDFIFDRDILDASVSSDLHAWKDGRPV